jgi:phosphoribosylaminoimidazole-succinocarboxamide synthase
MSSTVLVQKGKTKDFVKEGDIYKFVFTDRVTENELGEIDPGGDTLSKKTVADQGKACLLMSAAIFTELSKKDFRNHMVSYDIDKGFMQVVPAKLFDPNLEWIARWVCTGSFYRRYNFIPTLHDGMPLKNPIYEITFKNDERKDPLVVESAITALNVVDRETFQKLANLNEGVMSTLRTMFDKLSLDLWDVKVEYGLDESGNPMLIDEVGPGSCRAFKKGTKERVNGLELAKCFESFLAK